MSDPRPPSPAPRSAPGPEERVLHVTYTARGQRLDRFLAQALPSFSRRHLMEVVKAGHVRVDGRRARPGTTLAPGQVVTLPRLDAPRADGGTAEPARGPRGPGSEKRPGTAKGTGATLGPAAPSGPGRAIEIVHRDDDLLVVVKPPGVPCHGGAAMATRRTLLERLRADVLAGFGLVHRIDQDTSGLVILARGDLKVALAAAFAAEGQVEKVYDALVEGVPDPAVGTIDLPLADPGHGTRARVDPRRGKPATTEYSVTEVLGRAARVRAVPRTGRTHQIRVHLAWIGTPLLVDPLYGRRSGWRLVNPKGGPAGRLARTPLHAAELSFTDPRTGERLTFKTPLLDDHRRALEVLRVVAAREAARDREGLEALGRASPAADDRDDADDPAR
ncbi:MAG: RluA family pseudouridine synthase [Planctomycetia bacterium]|nr:RluA family pseudouridine synthase [Planctomycetia bacterium]